MRCQRPGSGLQLGMLSRRAILTAAALVPALAAVRPLIAKPPAARLGVQFFTFNALAATGWDGFSRALQMARDIGFTSIELAGLLGQPVESIRLRGQELGLEFHSFHMGSDQIRAARQPGESIQDVQDRIYTPEGVLEVARINLPIAKQLGCRWGVVAAAGRSNFATAHSTRRLCEAFNEANRLARSLSMNLSYHMHAHDFERVEGTTPFEMMIANTEPSMRFQLDVCWAAAAGIDPAQLIETHHARLVSLHLKDLAANRTESATAGEGILDFDSIRRAAARIQAPLFYVERDGAAGVDGIAEARKAYEFLTRHGW